MINSFPCKSYTVGINITTNYYSDSLQSKLPILNNQGSMDNFEGKPKNFSFPSKT